MTAHATHGRTAHTRAALALLGALVALPGLAQYKVTEPDGRVTYTDRAPQGNTAKVTAMNGRSSVPIEVSLPLELRQPASRYPVTLYVATGSCDPCDAARQLLRQRGIPYTEKLIVSPEDAEALQRLTGSRDAPTLTIGAQALRGLAPDVWSSYLDSAGYPRESRLPASYQYALATPLTERAEVKTPAAPAARPAAAPSPPNDGTAATAGIRF